MSLDRLSLVNRLRLTAAAVVAGVLGLAAWNGHAHYRASMDQKLAATRAVVQQATAIASRFEAEVRAGRLDVAAAQARAAEEVRAIRYDGSEYVWINDMGPRMVAHPIKPELDGKDLRDVVDPAGKHLFVEFVETVRRAGSGHVDYLWPKPGSDEPVHKRSYVAGFAPWGWVLGSGVYVDGVEAEAWNFASASIGAALLLGLGMMVGVHRLARSLQHRLDAATKALSEMAAGNLTARFDTGPADEIGRLLRTLDTTRDGLSQMVSSVRAGAESISTASTQIATGNQDLSARTEQTASNLQQTASSMEELTGTVRHTADAARQAEHLAGSAREAAGRGGGVMQAVVRTMDGIQASSRQIGEIIGVIDSIAFQTNILALNAAVEAARAGDQGRGFAVVASEVRGLAQRSADAAREIKALIGSSVDQVASGSTLVHDAGAAMAEIVASVQRMSDTIASISHASSEQSDGIGQVNQAVAHLDHMTQQNAALVEESAAATASLQEQARRLSDTMAKFRVPAMA